MGQVTVASCQFPVSRNIRSNGRHIRDFLLQAADRGADVLHTSEASLSGYAGVNFESFTGFEWGELVDVTAELCELSGELGMWLILGSSHRLETNLRPLNCLYVVDPRGAVVDRYDKSFLTGYPSLDDVPAIDRPRFESRQFPVGDHAHYSAGDRLVTLDIGSVRFGLAICYDMCWPQLYIAYRELGATVMLHSFHNSAAQRTCLTELTVHQAPTRCADNGMWAVCNNTSEPDSQWSTFVARPDATIAQQLAKDTPGLLLHRFPDAITSTGWTHNHHPLELPPGAMMHFGDVVDHPRRDPQAPPA